MVPEGLTPTFFALSVNDPLFLVGNLATGGWLSSHGSGASYASAAWSVVQKGGRRSSFGV